MHKCQYPSRVEQFVNNAGGEGGAVIMQAGTGVAAFLLLSGKQLLLNQSPSGTNSIDEKEF